MKNVQILVFIWHLLTERKSNRASDAGKPNHHLRRNKGNEPFEYFKFVRINRNDVSQKFLLYYRRYILSPVLRSQALQYF